MPTWGNRTLRYPGGSIHALLKRLVTSLLHYEDNTNISLELSDTMPMERCALVSKLIPHYNCDLFSYLCLKNGRRPLSIHSYNGSVDAIWRRTVDPSNVPVEEDCARKLAKAKEEKNEGQHS